jgi:hypothetical protein
MLGSGNLRIQQTERGYRVMRAASHQELVHLEPDGRWPNMWRIRRPDGSRSDMVNLTRAQDAALGAALSVPNRSRKKRAA